MNWPNALKRLRTCTCGRRHSPNIWVGEPSIGYARPGTMYNYGMCPPNYPVPAIQSWPNSGGGVQGDCAQVGAQFLDWSRGTLEIY